MFKAIIKKIVEDRVQQIEEAAAKTRGRCTDLEIEMEKLKGHIISLRGLVNKKLGNSGSEEEKDIKEGILPV